MFLASAGTPENQFQLANATVLVSFCNVLGSERIFVDNLSLLVIVDSVT